MASLAESKPAQDGGGASAAPPPPPPPPSPETLISLVPGPLPEYVPATAPWFVTASTSGSDNYKALVEHLTLFWSQAVKLGLLLTMLYKPTPYSEIYPLLRSTATDNLTMISSCALALHSTSPCKSLWKDVSHHINALSKVYSELLTYLSTVVATQHAQPLTNGQSQSTVFVSQLQVHASHLIHSNFDPTSKFAPKLRASPLWSNRIYMRRSAMKAAKAVAEVVVDFVDRENNFTCPSIPTELYYEITGSDRFNEVIDNTEVGQITENAGLKPATEGEELWSDDNMLKVFNCYSEIDAAFVISVVSVLRALHARITALFGSLDAVGAEDPGSLYSFDEACVSLVDLLQGVAGTLSPAALDVEEDGETYVAIRDVVDKAGEMKIDLESEMEEVRVRMGMASAEMLKY